MPSPGLYVVVVVVGVAAGIAFKEFVYDPHLAPKIDEWTGAYAAYRRERRRRKASPHSHLDDKDDDHDSDAKSSIEPEGSVEREMRTFGGEGTLRQRRPAVSEMDGLEMMEKPNTFIPFVPLSPTPPPPSSNPFLGPRETALPIGRLSTPQSDNPSSRTPAPSGESRTSDIQHMDQPPIPPNPFLSSSTSSEGLPSLPAPVPTSPRMEIPMFDHSVEPRSGSASEYDLALSASRGTTPFTSADISRIGTPFTDVWSRSSSSDESRSEASFAPDLERSSPYLDASFLHATAYSRTSLDSHSDLSLDGHSESSLDTSASSPLDSRSDASLDFMGSEGDPHVETFDMLSPVARNAVLSDEEWERMSETGR